MFERIIGAVLLFGGLFLLSWTAVLSSTPS